jgi:hypothetical protein
MQGLDVPEMGAEGYAGYTDYYPEPPHATHTMSVEKPVGATVSPGKV